MRFRLALAALLGALAQSLIVAAGEQESVRSSPPDTTPYNRPAIPEDYASKPAAPEPSPERREPPTPGPRNNSGGPADPTPRAPTIPGAPTTQTK
jgi:hypothetical protein